jgi:hypothetical protein
LVLGAKPLVDATCRTLTASTLAVTCPYRPPLDYKITISP